MCESMYIYTCTSELHMYPFSSSLNRFLDLISTCGLISIHTLSKLPNFNRTFVLVYTFIVLEFLNLISCVRACTYIYMYVHLNFTYVSV